MRQRPPLLTMSWTVSRKWRKQQWCCTSTELNNMPDVTTLWISLCVFFVLLSYRPATIHFSTIRHKYPDTVVTIPYTIRYDTLYNNKTRTRRVLPRVLLVGSEVCTADKPTAVDESTHVFVVSAILNIMLNTAQHGFFSSVCSENRHAEGLKSGRRAGTNWRQCFPMFDDAYVNVS